MLIHGGSTAVMEPHVVKIFGERNTGTRALGALVRQVPNVTHRIRPRSEIPPFDGAVEAAIESQMRGHWRRLYLHALRDDQAATYAQDDPWKHALPRLTDSMIEARVKTLLLVRNPYSWLIGLARRPYHLKGPQAQTLDDFAARPWMTERREGLPAVLASPLDLWSRKMRGCLDYRTAAHEVGLPSKIIRFEAFVQNPKATAAMGLHDLGIQAQPLSDMPKNTKEKEPDLTVLQRYYTQELWRARLTRETVRRVNARVDWDVAGALDYQRLDPHDFPEVLPEAEAQAMRAEMASLASPVHWPASQALHRETGTAAAT